MRILSWIPLWLGVTECDWVFEEKNCRCLLFLRVVFLAATFNFFFRDAGFNNRQFRWHVKSCSLDEPRSELSLLSFCKAIFGREEIVVTLEEASSEDRFSI